MAQTLTTQIPLGYKAPDFTLLDVVSKRQISLADVKGEKATLVMFICNHCPFVIHVIDELVLLANDYLEKGVKCVAISANDVENYPDDSPQKMEQLAVAKKFSFPYLYDESQKVAKAYAAVCTPDFSVFDANMKCIYRGQLDDARPGNNVPVNGNNLREVLDNVLAEKSISLNQIPSMGCNIKWKQ